MKEFEVFPWDQPRDDHLTLLIMHFSLIPFAEILVVALEKNSAVISTRNVMLKRLAAELAQQTKELEEQHSQFCKLQSLNSRNVVSSQSPAYGMKNPL